MENMEEVEMYHSKISLHKFSESIDKDERLVSKVIKPARDVKSTLPVILVVGGSIVVRIPKMDEHNLGVRDNLGKYLQWASTLLGYDATKIRIISDATLGTTVALPVKLNRFMDNTMAQCVSIASNVDRHQFSAGIKGNTAELIAACKVMRRYSGLVHKSLTLPKGASPVTLLDLKRVINARAGLDETSLTRFEQAFVRGVLNELTKVNARYFPGEYIRSLRNINGVSSNTGVLYKLGYEPKVMNAKKLHYVVTQKPLLVTVKPSDEKERQSKSQPKEKDEIKLVVKQLTRENHPGGGSHQEVRTLIAGSTPYLSTRSKNSIKAQITRDILDVRESRTLEFYNRNREFVDAVNTAYACGVSIGRKGSKSTVAGYNNLRNHAIALSNDIGFLVDDKTVNKIEDVPESWRNHFFAVCCRLPADRRTDADTAKVMSYLEGQKTLRDKLSERKTQKTRSSHPEQTREERPSFADIRQELINFFGPRRPEEPDESSSDSNRYAALYEEFLQGNHLGVSAEESEKATSQQKGKATDEV